MTVLVHPCSTMFHHVPPHASSGCQKTCLQITGEMVPAPRYTMILVVAISFQLQMFPLFRRLDWLWWWRLYLLQEVLVGHIVRFKKESCFPWLKPQWAPMLINVGKLVDVSTASFLGRMGSYWARTSWNLHSPANNLSCSTCKKGISDSLARRIFNTKEAEGENAGEELTQESATWHCGK